MSLQLTPRLSSRCFLVGAQLEEPWGVAVDIDENGVIVGFVAGLVDSLPVERAVIWRRVPVEAQRESLGDVKALYRR